MRDRLIKQRNYLRYKVLESFMGNLRHRRKQKTSSRYRKWYKHQLNETKKELKKHKVKL